MPTLSEILNKKILELEAEVTSLTAANKELFEVLVFIKQRENRYPDPVVNKLVMDALEALKSHE